MQKCRLTYFSHAFILHLKEMIVFKERKQTLTKTSNLIINENYFRINHVIYKQKEGVPMASPISSILAELKFTKKLIKKKFKKLIIQWVVLKFLESNTRNNFSSKIYVLLLLKILSSGSDILLDLNKPNFKTFISL